MSSSTTGQWIRRSPSSKQGPLKATIPMSSLTKQQNTNLKQQIDYNTNNSLSPTTSYWKFITTISPETSSSCGLRSPGAVNYKGKHKNVRSQSCNNDYTNISMRRTASLDTIYLTGYWPRESLYLNNLQVDRSTQTEDWLGDQSRKNFNRTQHSTDMLSGNNEDKLEKFIRHRLSRTKETNIKDRNALLLSSSGSNLNYGLVCLSAETSSMGSDSNIIGSEQTTNNSQIIVPSSILSKGGSIEGLNQEIERLVLRSTISNFGGGGNFSGGSQHNRHLDRHSSNTYIKGCDCTPEGHRAPVADLLRQTRSVNTQTPAYTDCIGGGGGGGNGNGGSSSQHSSGPPSRDSGSPAGSALTNRSDSRPSSDFQGVSEDSSPETEGRQLGTSPRINRFLEREPPDGCERVSLRFTDENRKPMVDISEMDYPLKPSVNFQLKPSLGSAFQPLKSTQ